MAQELTRELRSFIEHCFTTAVQVEVLLLLHSDGEGIWSASAVSRELRIDPEHASTAMAHLAGKGLLLSTDAGYRLAPRRKRDSELVDAMAALYPSYRVTIISIIFSKPSGPIRDFSDVVPDTDLSTWRLVPSAAGTLLLVYGLVWDAE